MDLIKCKRCNNSNIRIVEDMKLEWVECDRCKTTYQLEADEHMLIRKAVLNVLTNHKVRPVEPTDENISE